MTFRRPFAFIWLFVAFTSIGVFFGLHTYLNDPSSTLKVRLYYELTGAWAAMILIPALGWLTRVAPFSRGNRARALALNVVGVIGYTLAHSTIELLMRYAALPVVGFHYSLVGMAQTTYLPDAPGDVVYYGFIITSLYLIRNFVASQHLEARLAEAKLENLRLQLQPHFLFNTLNAISSVMYEDVPKADAMLSKLSDFLRAVLDCGTVNEVTLEEELKIERMYVDIMTTRLERNLSLCVRVADDSKNSAVPFMLLQPLIENSIQHGMGSERTALSLDIDVSRHNGSTVITVDDDGLGIAPGASRGIGLSNVAARLEYMYGGRAHFDIAPRTQGGTRATMTFPYSVGATS